MPFAFQSQQFAKRLYSIWNHWRVHSGLDLNNKVAAASSLAPPVHLLSRHIGLYLSEHICILHKIYGLPVARKSVMRPQTIISTRYFTIHVWYVRMTSLFLQSGYAFVCAAQGIVPGTGFPKCTHPTVHTHAPLTDLKCQ